MVSHRCGRSGLSLIAGGTRAKEGPGARVFVGGARAGRAALAVSPSFSVTPPLTRGRFRPATVTPLIRATAVLDPRPSGRPRAGVLARGAKGHGPSGRTQARRLVSRRARLTPSRVTERFSGRPDVSCNAKGRPGRAIVAEGLCACGRPMDPGDDARTAAGALGRGGRGRGGDGIGHGPALPNDPPCKLGVVVAGTGATRQGRVRTTSRPPAGRSRASVGAIGAPRRAITRFVGCAIDGPPHPTSGGA